MMSKRSATTALSASSGARNFFLLKSEPNEFSIHDLAKSADQQSPWTGIRNASAKKNLCAAAVGDRFFFYHSSDGVRTGIVGTGTFTSKPRPDPTAKDPTSPYFDSKMKAGEEDKGWQCVDVKLEEIFPRTVLLSDLKARAAAGNAVIAGMTLFKMSRLSVQRLTEDEWHEITRISRETPAAELGTVQKRAKKSKAE